MLLARSGFDVTVLERRDRVGGRTSAIEMDGFRFDMGPTFFLYPQVLRVEAERWGPMGPSSTFLGLGVKDGASWGIMIAYSGQEVVNGHFWQIGAATVFMFGLVLAFNILSDALQDAFDPKHV